MYVHPVRMATTSSHVSLRRINPLTSFPLTRMFTDAMNIVCIRLPRCMGALLRVKAHYIMAVRCDRIVSDHLLTTTAPSCGQDKRTCQDLSRVNRVRSWADVRWMFARWRHNNQQREDRAGNPPCILFCLLSRSEWSAARHHWWMRRIVRKNIHCAAIVGSCCRSQLVK